MEKLKAFIQNKEDSVWENLQDIDIKNLFPKYQVTKIQKSKTRFDKFRLIMDNIDDFLYFERHKKGVDDLTQQIEDFQNEILACEKEFYEKQEHHYDLDFMKNRQYVDKLTTQLNRYGNNIKEGKKQGNLNLQSKISQNPKWEIFFKDQCQNVAIYKKNQLLPEKVKLSENIHQFGGVDALNGTVSGQILLRKLEKQQTNKALTNQWVGKGQLSNGTELIAKDELFKEGQLQQYV